MGEDAVLVVSLERAGVLAYAVLDDLPRMRHEHLLAPCPAPIVPDTGRDVAQQVTTAHVDLRHDLLQCQRLTLETTLDLLPRLGVIVVDASIGDVTDAATATVQPLGQFHVLQARHGFVEAIAVPCLAGNGRVGVVAEEPVLRNARLIGIVLAEDAAFTEVAFRAADLLAVAVVAQALRDRLAKIPQPA